MEKELKSKTSVHKSAHSAAETGHSSVAGGEKHNHNKTSQGLSVANASNIEKATTEFFDTNGAKLGIKVLIPVKTLMESGAYMGLPAKARNPKMSPYIAENKGSKAQIINLIKTIAFLDQACSVVQDIVKRGGRVLFVGTQNDVIKNHIKDECARTQSFYVNQRWLGGTLTNYKTVSKSVNKFNDLLTLQQTGEISKYDKKEQVQIGKEIVKFERFLGGIRTLRGLPQLVIVTNPIVEHNAVAEARKLNIPVIAIANTDANPDLIEHIIPANNHSMRTVWLIISALADSIALAKGEPATLLGKKASDIVLPEPAKANQTKSVLNHKTFGRFNRETPSSK